MNDPRPKSLWQTLREAIDDWIGDPEELADDPSLAFHLCFTAPLVIGFLLIARSTAA